MPCRCPPTAAEYGLYGKLARTLRKSHLRNPECGAAITNNKQGLLPVEGLLYRALLTLYLYMGLALVFLAKPGLLGDIHSEAG